MDKKNKFRFKEREKKTWPTIREATLDALWGTPEKEREESTKVLPKNSWMKNAWTLTYHGLRNVFVDRPY